MNILENILLKKEIPSYITPLFWQHNEDEKILREEIKQMSKNGIGSFIVESRPHPDFLGVKWWHDLDVIIDEARKRGMKVWLFDDCAFPSGFAAGRIRDNHPEYLKVYLDERHIDAKGPLKGSSFVIKAWLDHEESLVAVIAAKRIDGIDTIDGESLTDITRQISNGILYWDVPEGNWRIFILVCTRNGGEIETGDYLNPIEPEPVRAFIDYVYEEHYRHYADEFGKTIAGFFSDEPRFGNASTYEGALGNFNRASAYIQNGSRVSISKMVLPYSHRLLSHLEKAWNGEYKQYLPCLWYDAGEITAGVRFVFMDVVSKLFGENYTQQIGDWCRKHGIKYIGHLVEDNGAHARLGYGPGHFFRAIKGQDCSGMDLVYQVWPEITSGKHSTPLGYLDADFFYWGITKMASSAGHIDPEKKGTTVCEIFGAYGWQAGLKLMKWLTDHVCVRGVNFLIPHAFSPRKNDPDCPPHFYARGENPQWRYFHVWSSYANRVCHLLSGGKHVASVAVLYHAEAEWSGKYMPFEKVVKVLAKRQIDCDVIPIDTFLNLEALIIERGRFTINGEEFKAVVIPYAEKLPVEFLAALGEIMKMDIPVFFIDEFPLGTSNVSTGFAEIMDEIRYSSYAYICSCEGLSEKIFEIGLHEMETSTFEENLRSYHYIHDKESIYFLTNESKYMTIYTELKIKVEGYPVLYDAMSNRIITTDYVIDNGYTKIWLYLQPYESIIILLKNSDQFSLLKVDPFYNRSNFTSENILAGKWKVSTSQAPECSEFSLQPLIRGLGNISIPSLLPEFSGTIRYETEFYMTKYVQTRGICLDLGDVYETAEVWINGKPVGIRICPPYTFDVMESAVDGRNSLRVDVTNTLAKKLGCNVFDRAMPQEPSGLLGPVKVIFYK